MHLETALRGYPIYESMDRFLSSVTPRTLMWLEKEIRNPVTLTEITVAMGSLTGVKLDGFRFIWFKAMPFLEN